MRSQIICFNGEAKYCNDPKSGLGSLGLEQAQFDFAEEVIQVVRERFPEVISEQVLRIDFWRNVETGAYFLNEIEGN